MTDLDLAGLPPLPQSPTIARLAGQLWRDERVVALWLGGSLARGAGDRYSDVDLRVAVAPADLAAWRQPDLAALFDDTVLGRHLLSLGEGALLHHLILADEVILDFMVQSTARSPLKEPILVLGCRSPELARALSGSSHAPALAPIPIDAAAVRQLLVDFWINSHKHRKVLHRGLDLMIPTGLHGERMMLLRLWYLHATGEDLGPQQLQGIHGLSALVRAIAEQESSRSLALLGTPLRDRAEIYAAIEGHRDEVARVGRALAARHGVEYPERLELMVRRAWEAFRRSVDACAVEPSEPAVTAM